MMHPNGIRQTWSSRITQAAGKPGCRMSNADAPMDWSWNKYALEWYSCKRWSRGTVIWSEHYSLNKCKHRTQLPCQAVGSFFIAIRRRHRCTLNIGVEKNQRATDDRWRPSGLTVAWINYKNKYTLIHVLLCVCTFHLLTLLVQLPSRKWTQAVNVQNRVD